MLKNLSHLGFRLTSAGPSLQPHLFYRRKEQEPFTVRACLNQAPSKVLCLSCLIAGDPEKEHGAARCLCRRKTDLENFGAGKRSRGTSSPQYVIKLTWENLEGTNRWEGFPRWYRVHLQSKRKWQLTPVFSPGKSHGQSGLQSYDPWGCKEPAGLSDQTTEGRNWQPMRPSYAPGTLVLGTI